MNGGTAWRWDRKGKVALAFLAGFQVIIFLIGKLWSIRESRAINQAIEAAEGGEKALAFVGGILRAASSGYWIHWTWLIGSALLAVPAITYRPRRVQA